MQAGRIQVSSLIQRKPPTTRQIYGMTLNIYLKNILADRAVTA
jgi:hypothetical protein